MNWRIILVEEHNAFLNMAIDEAISESVAQGKSLPTIRFYTWKPSAVSIGCFQSMGDEIDTNICKNLGVDAVRRRTGGGAVYHDNLGEITYSVIAPQAMFPSNIVESYKVICGWIIDSLALLSVSADFIPINDIVTSGKKISGNAQTRRNGILLQHGTILYAVDVKKMFSLLKVPSEKIRDKMIATVEERVTSIKRQNPEITKEKLCEALLKGFTNNKKYSFGKLSKEEFNRAKELVEIRYSTREWNFSR